MPRVADADSQEHRIEEFIRTKDLYMLTDPVHFPKSTLFSQYLCCDGMLSCLVTMLLSGIFCPVATFCPCWLATHYSLSLDKDELHLTTASNDFCIHIAKSSRTIPLDKVQEVGLSASCTESCCGVQSLSIQTASTVMEDAEVVATFLADPKMAQDAIQLAIKLSRPLGAPGQQGMARQAPSDTLSDRLGRLQLLVRHGLLTQNEAEAIEGPALQSKEDPLLRLVEGLELWRAGGISQQQLYRLKKQCMRKLR